VRWLPAWELALVQCRQELVGESVTEPQFSHCELLLLEACSCSMETVGEPRVRETSAIGSRYQAMTGEENAD
jgi:hypothetical protein